MPELSLQDLPDFPLFRLMDAEGREVHQSTEVAGESATVAAVFADQNLAEEFSANAREFGMEAFAGCEPVEVSGWDDLEKFAAGGADYVLVVAMGGTGIFHAGDVALHAAERAAERITERASERAEEWTFPLYVISDERGESPLILVQTTTGEILVAALFTSPEKARVFRQSAAHLDLPDGLGGIPTEDGLRRHARVAQKAGAEYAVVDPESGLSDAIPLDELFR